ncbi:MAG: nucleotidyltransferase [Acidobacteriota bacterium]|nr:nucleotidyltransferase [Acidobacteriota bacterium]
MAIPARPSTSTSGRATSENADRVILALRAFGFDLPALEPKLFINPKSIVRLGTPPFRIELMTSIDGVEFDGCAGRAVTFDLGGVAVRVISLPDLKANKRAAGRHKDLADLDNLP